MKFMKSITTLLCALCLMIAVWSCTFTDRSAKTECRPEFIMPEYRPGLPALEFIAVGDSGSGDIGQDLVAYAMEIHAARYPVNAILYLGDNFYESGVSSANDPKFQTHFEEMYDPTILNMPFYAILGNHDYRGNVQAQVDYSQISSRWVMPAFYYTFTMPPPTGNSSKENWVQVFALDTTPIVDGQDPGQQMTWLEEQLKNSTARWKIVIGHHPVFSNGQHGGDETLNLLLIPLFRQYGVDMYISGHDHDLQILRVNGFHQLVSGGGSRIRDTLCRGNSEYAAGLLGFMSLRLYEDRCEVYVVIDGGRVDFAYLIEK